MNTFTVSFFGHRVIEDPLRIEQRLEPLIRKLLKEKEYVEFLVGRDGEFDQIVSSTIRRCKRTVRDDNSAHVWVLPYPTADFRDNEEAYRDYYDEIEICASSAGGHFKGAYQTRNREMVDRADLIVFCIQHESGGAWQTMKYARKQNIPYINLNESVEEVL
ncbi:MAG: hypothetical protein J6J18_10010 [Oscillospiraceae bacterium]|nr:hypothetical protein [Oscillospiraceae bacterium]